MILCSKILKGLNLFSLSRGNLSQPVSILGTEYEAENLQHSSYKEIKWCKVGS